MLKYLLGTAGIGFLYVRGELIPALTPSNSGWFAQERITAMDITANRPSPTARRFEAGTPPVVNCYAAEAGLKLILEVGTDAIEERIRALTRRCLQGLEDIGWAAVTPAQDERRGPMVAIASRDSAGLFAKLMEQDIVTSFRDANLRATVHFYNSEEDIDAFVAAMRASRTDFHPAP
jgi:selenocysteine lyase/cysteine desulfurase